MSELHHECGVAAIYHLPNHPTSELSPGSADMASSLIPRMLLDMQNRGQLSAGISRFHPKPENGQLIDTYRELGSVQEVFRLSHEAKANNLMKKWRMTRIRCIATIHSPWRYNPDGRLGFFHYPYLHRRSMRSQYNIISYV